MHNNSLEVYKKYWNNGKGDHLRYKVYNYIKQNPLCTLLDICEILHKEKNSISGRITDLKQKGLIAEVGNKIISISGKSVNYSQLKAVA